MATSVTTRSPLVASLLRQQRDADDDEHVLVGCSLPPKVTGVPRGAVLLSVPRILSSVAAEAVAENEELRRAVLPRVALVRVRWWGEEKPGSTLFRPKRVAQDAARRRDDEEQKYNDGNGDEGDSLLCMRYPVCVPAQQLLEYLRDMKELVLDVIDRETRKKVGRGVFPFVLDDAALTSPIDMMKKLSRTDALCEIRAAAAPHDVLGYLTVNFEIEWTATATSVAPSVSTPLKWTNTNTAAPAITVNPAVQPSRLGIPQEPEHRIQQRLSFSSLSSSSSSSTLREMQAKPAYRSRTSGEPAVNKVTRPVVGADRLEALLEKGRALQRSMSVATKNEPIVQSTTIEPISAGPHDESASTTYSPPMSMGAMLAPYEAMTEDVDNDWEHVLAEAEASQPTRATKETRAQAVENMKHRLDSMPVSLGEHNALEISFETMELEQETIDQLRQLREGSVSTRFSPIQLVVSHEHPRFLFGGSESHEKDTWIAAFAVNSSLRKRQWRTNYSHTLPLHSDQSVGRKSTEGRVQVQQRALRFRVRCEPQHASPTGKRRRDTRQRLDLWTEVPLQELLENRQRGRVMSLPLRLGDEANNQESKRPSSMKRKRQPVGTITVKFRFCTLQDDEGDDVGSESQSEGSVSSDWSLTDENTNPLRASPSTKQPRSPLLGHRSTGDVGGSLFFALLIDRATIRLAAELEDSIAALAQIDNSSRWSLRLDYGTPAFFGRAAKTLRLKRSAKARLRRSENGVMRAMMGHMNAFPIEMSDEFIEKLHGGLLILEVWLQEQSKTLTSFLTEKLLGIVKIPLRAFSPLMRDADQLSRRLQHSTPVIGVDQDFPIIDPLTDHVNGQIQVRVGLGTAEQLFHFKSTLAAVVKLQSHVRGWLTRRELHYWQQFELVDVGGEGESHEATAQAQSDKVNRSSEASSAVEYGDEERVLDSSGNDDSIISVDGVWQPELSHPIVRVEIQVEIRESYGRANHDVIGCEVYGLLRFQEQHTVAALLNSSGPRFTLWWDAQDAELNSHFVHNFQASDPLAGIHLQDMALLFRVEPQFAVTHRVGDGSSANPKGVAAIDLAEVVATHGGQSVQRDSDRTLIHRDIDVQIEWSGSDKDNDRQAYASMLPLRIGLQLSRGSFQPREAQPDELVLTTESTQLELPRERVTTLETVSRTERLLPATLRLCLDIQRVSDMKELVLARLVEAKRQPGESQIQELLERAVQNGAVSTTLMMSLCLGRELHEAERDHDERETSVTQNDQGQWIKQFRFEDIELQVRDGVQSLPSITQGDADVMVHPELVSFLQEGSLEVQLLLNDDKEEASSAATTLGTVSIPLASILFRPSGVQGSFPVRVCDDVLSGRIGVHLYIEQENSNEPAASNAVLAEMEETSDHSVSSSKHSSSAGDSIAQSIADDEEAEGTHKEDELEETDDHEEWFTEQSIADAVGSMHKTSRSIDDRLARMKSQSFHADSPHIEHAPALPHDHQPVAITPPARAPSAAVEASDLERPDEFSGVLEGGDLQSEPRESGSEAPASERDIDAIESVDADPAGDAKLEEEDRDGDAEEELFYQPITLESLGIDEIALSPVTEPSPSPLTVEEDSPIAASPKRNLEEEEEEKEDDDEEDGVRRELDDLSVSDGSHIDGMEPSGFELDGGDDEIDMSQLEVGSHGGEETSEDDDVFDHGSLGSIRSSPRSESILSSCEATQTTEDVTISEPAPLEDSKTTMTDNAEPLAPSPVVVELSPPVEPVDAETKDADASAHLSVEELAREATDVKDDADTLLQDEINGHDDGESNITKPDEAPIATEVNSVASDHPSIDESCDREDPRHEDTAEDEAMAASEIGGSGTVESLASSQRPVQVYVCDDATQTEGVEGLEVVETSERDTLEEATSGRRDAEPQVSRDDTVDSACQTAIDDLSSITTASVEPVPSRDAPETTTTSVTGQHLALPTEKFNLAWQLLNEIRALYVDTSVGPPQAIPEPETPDRSVNRSTNADSPPEEEESREHEQTKPTATTADSVLAEEHNSSISMSEEVIIQEAKRHDVGAIWQWRDEASLRAEVDERLRQSKHEYEEALALSQSVHSVRSWSSSFADNDQRQKAEQIAIDLSASALERRARNARAILFRVDTETERIARIMQGSLSYWVREDEDDGDDYDARTSDDDDDEDAFGYF